MSTLDRQIKELTLKANLLTTNLANMEDATEDEIVKAETELSELEAILENLVQIRTDQADNNEVIANTYSTATNALTQVSALAAQSEKLASHVGVDSETKKNQIRTNTYYGKQYEEYKNLFITITIVCVCMIASLLLAYTQFEYVSRTLTLAIGILGGAVIAYKMIGILLRSNMDYDEYNWIGAPVTDDGIKTANSGDDKLLDISGISLGTICIGPRCCSEGTEWNSKKGCVLIQPQDITEDTSEDTTMDPTME
jgi:hypothetical protein